jgi:MFS family permease
MGGYSDLLLSTRGSILVLLWLCNVSLYLSRTNISVAIIYMYPSNENLEGELLAAFYVGYCFQTLGGWLATRFGPKTVLMCAVSAWSGATLLTACFGKNVPVLFLLRAVVGLAEGCNYPSQMQLVSVWVRYEERATAWSFMSTGESIGTILALLGGPFVVHAAGWPTVFLVSGSLGAVWLAIFGVFGASSPSCHRRISRHELAHILASRPPRAPIVRTPWRAFFRSRSFLAIIATHCCFNWSCYFSLSWTSKFFSSAYSADYSSLGILSVLPYIVLFGVSAVAGRIADLMESRLGFSATAVRKIFNSLGMLGSAVAFLGLGLVAPGGGGDGHAGGKYAATALLTLAVGAGGFAVSAGYWASFVDISPRHAQVWHIHILLHRRRWPSPTRAGARLIQILSAVSWPYT